MDLQRQEYPALLAGLDPETAVDVLNGRVAVINKVHADIADWLAERRKVEEQYAASLRKLARRPQQDNATALGIFQMPWQRIVGSVENMAQSHETLAAKIQADVETPLRSYSSTNHELSSMGNMSGNLAAIAKDLSAARKKAQKLEGKGSDRAEGAKSSVDDANSQWDSQAPFVFEQLQSADEARINHLRDVLTQYQTHELDQVERGRSSAEHCLSALLEIETSDEIKAFATKARGQAGSAPLRQDSIAMSTRTGKIPPTPPPPRNIPIDQRTSSFAQQDQLSPLPETPKEKKLSGLKRLGTVMGRRKNAVPPPPPSEKKKESRKSFAPFRRQESSRSFVDLDSTGRDLTPVASLDDRASSRHGSVRPPQTQESRVSDAAPPALNGIGNERSEQAPVLPQISALQPASPTVPEAPAAYSFDNERTSTRPDPFAQATASPTEESARAFEIKDKPITEDASAAQLAMDNMANQLRIQAQSSGLNRGQGTLRGRRDVRNTMFFPSPSPQELPTSETASPVVEKTIPETAPTSIATNLPTLAAIPSVASPVRTDSISQTSDTQSIHSSYSTAAGGAHHQEMNAPGLNASIVETVNTWLSDEGVTRSFVVGEVALAHNQSGDQRDTEVIRLQNFHQLEKCAQNPQFITPADGDHQPGTYNLNLSSISRSLPTVAFKYQLHLDETNLAAYSPLLITQAWQIIEGQASVILMYSLNPAFSQIANPGSSPLPHLQEFTLKNVTISISLDKEKARAIGAQMMPLQHASFKKKSGAVAWRFPELIVKTTQERLLVRFMIENNGLAGRGGVDVKFEAKDTLASALGVERLGQEKTDPFADEDSSSRWEDVQSRKVLVSGKYTAM